MSEGEVPHAEAPHSGDGKKQWPWIELAMRPTNRASEFVVSGAVSRQR